MADIISLRQDTTINFVAVNPVLGIAELGLDTTLNRLKAGDGSTAWNSLPYIGDIPFTDLSQVPASYSSQGTKCLAVNSGETAIEFITKDFVTQALVDSKDAASLVTADAYTDSEMTGEEDLLGTPASLGRYLASTTGGTRSWDLAPQAPRYESVMVNKISTDSSNYRSLAFTVNAGETWYFNFTFTFAQITALNPLDFDINLTDDSDVFVLKMADVQQRDDVVANDRSIVTASYKLSNQGAGDYKIHYEAISPTGIFNTNSVGWCNALVFPVVL